MLKDLFKKAFGSPYETYYLLLTPDADFKPVTGRWGHTFDQAGALAEKIADWSIENDYLGDSIKSVGHKALRDTSDKRPCVTVACLPPVIGRIKEAFPQIAEIKQSEIFDRPWLLQIKKNAGLKQ